MKWLFRLFYAILFGLFGFTLWAFHSQSFLQYALNYATSKELLVAKKVEGSLANGVKIDGLQIDGVAKVDSLSAKLDYIALLSTKLHFNYLDAQGLLLDESLFEEKESQEKPLFIPFVSISADSLNIGLKPHIYQDYSLESAKLSAKDVRYNFKDLFASATIFLQSNVATLDANATLKAKNYDISAIISPNLAFLKPLSPISIETLTPLEVNAKGDEKSVDFKIDVNSFKSDIALLKGLKLEGNYAFNSQKLQSGIRVNVSEKSGIDAKVDGNFSIADWDIKSLKADLKSDVKVTKKYIDNYASGVFKDDVSFLASVKGGVEKLHFEITSPKQVVMVEKMPFELLDFAFLGEMTYLDEQIKATFDSKAILKEWGEYALKNGTLNYGIQSKKLTTNADISLKTPYAKAQSKVTARLENGLFVETKSVLQDLHFSDFSYAEAIMLDASLTPSNFQLLAQNDQIKAFVQSGDLKAFTFSVVLQPLEISRFYALPSFLKIDKVRGSANGRYNGVLEFNSELFLDEHFSLDAKAKIENSGLFELSAKQSAFALNASGDIKNAKMDLMVKELDKFTQELSKILEKPLPPLEGAFKLEATKKSDEVHFVLTSPKAFYEDNAIEKLNLSGFLNEDMLKVRTLTFSLKSGFGELEPFSLQKDGEVHFSPLSASFDFGKLSLNYVDNALKIRLNEFFFDFKKYAKGVVSGSFDMNFRDEKIEIKGGASLKNGVVVFATEAMGISSDPDIVIVKKRDEAREKKEEGFLEKVALEVTLDAQNLAYEVKNIALKMNTKLEAKKDFGKDVRLFGKVEEIKGSVSEFGKLYEIDERSSVQFKGEEHIDPLLNVIVLHTIDDVKITIFISGALSSPKLRFSSEPSMSQQDILSYLLFGSRLGDVGKGSQSLSSKASLFFVNELSKSYAKSIGLDVLSFEYDATNQFIQTIIGKKIIDGTTVILKNTAGGGIGVLQQMISKHWSAELGVGGDAQSVDIIYKKRY